MVDSVKFGPARPVPGPRGLNLKDAAAAREPAPIAPPPQRLSLATALAHKGPPFDVEKVATLKAAIASGTYQIDLGGLADGMIRFGGRDLA
jgi:negative regulator of flagellin synthesis FlgM